jgi:hypothetical protein
MKNNKNIGREMAGCIHPVNNWLIIERKNYGYDGWRVIPKKLMA